MLLRLLDLGLRTFELGPALSWVHFGELHALQSFFLELTEYQHKFLIRKIVKNVKKRQRPLIKLNWTIIINNFTFERWCWKRKYKKIYWKTSTFQRLLETHGCIKIVLFIIFGRVNHDFSYQGLGLLSVHCASNRTYLLEPDFELNEVHIRHSAQLYSTVISQLE